jgi:hypothetical protein
VLKRRCRLLISINQWSLIGCWNVYNKKMRSGRRGTDDVFIVSFLNDNFPLTFSEWHWFSLLLVACSSMSICLQFMYPAWRLQLRLSLSGANPCWTNSSVLVLLLSVQPCLVSELLWQHAVVCLYLSPRNARPILWCTVSGNAVRCGRCWPISPVL